MKAILISIKPKYVADILNGKKTLEIRKTIPNCELPIDVYIYCTHDKKDKLFKNLQTNEYLLFDWQDVNGFNGSVVAKFTLKEVRPIYVVHFNTYYEYKPVDMLQAQLEIRSCLNQIELDNYLHKKKGYAWCIDNVVAFNKPKQLSEFDIKVRDNVYRRRKAPQSWCYVEVE